MSQMVQNRQHPLVGFRSTSAVPRSVDGQFVPQTVYGQTHSSSVTESIHNERECWRGLSAARVVQVITWTRRTPIRDNTHESTLLNSRFDQVLR